MARYSKIDRRIWADEKFRALTPPQPCGQSLWFNLLTSPKASAIPGLISAGEAELAEFFGWPLEDFRKAFQEAYREGMVKADWRARLIWLPNACKYNVPESPNVIKSWRIPWDELPECQLKLESWQALKAFTEGLKKAFQEAFIKSCPKPSLKPLANPEPEPKQEPEQKPKQDQKPEKLESNSQIKSVAEESETTPPPPHENPLPEVVHQAQRPKPPKQPKEPSPTAKTWEAYSVAYAKRYGAEPTRNATVNGQLAQFVARVPIDEAPLIAMFYVGHGGQFYANKMHSVGLLLSDAEKLRTEWLTNRKMTSTAARQSDQTTSNADLANRLIEEYRNGSFDPSTYRLG